MNKKELRKVWTEKLKQTQMPSQIKVKEALLKNSLLQSADNIFAYVPFKTEINIKSFIDEIIKTKNVFLPICLEERQLKFCQIDKEWKDNLERSQNKTLIPINKVITPLKEIKGTTVILIPGLAFNLKKYRLGRGGGYYDTLLEKLKDDKNYHSIGLCTRSQIISELNPDPFDRPMDDLIII